MNDFNTAMLWLAGLHKTVAEKGESELADCTNDPR